MNTIFVSMIVSNYVLSNLSNLLFHNQSFPCAYTLPGWWESLRPTGTPRAVTESSNQAGDVEDEKVYENQHNGKSILGGFA